MPTFDRRLFAALLVAAIPTAAIADLPECSKLQDGEHVANRDEAEEHRLFERPAVSYPAKSPPDDYDHYPSVSMRVDESGKPICLFTGTPYAATLRINDLRASVQGWRYRPFERDGKSVTLVVSQEIDVELLSDRTANVPSAPSEDFRMTLVRGGCFWGCPQYAVTVLGDGRVGYHGMRNVVVDGTRAWMIPAADVAPLVALGREPRLWAAEERYTEDVHDAETIMIRVDAGGQRKQIRIYPARNIASPVAARRLARALDKVSGARLWVGLSDDTIDALVAEGFDFRSPAAGEMLARSVRWDGRTNVPAVLRLLELGTPVAPVRPDADGTVLDVVLHQRIAGLMDPLLGRGVLMTNGRPDPKKIDSAFRAAIRGGRLEPAQRIWNIAGGDPHPALDFAEVGPDGQPSHHRSPVVLLLDGSDYRDDAWEGVAIARWLESLGNDLSAIPSDSRGLMHTAVRRNDPALMNFLLSRNIDPSPAGQWELLRFSVRHGEDMALALLEAQSRHSRTWVLAQNFRATAELQQWPRVLAWLDAHPEVVEYKKKPL